MTLRKYMRKELLRTIPLILVLLLLAIPVTAQTELLTNSEVIQLTRAGLSKELVIRKVKESKTNFDLTSSALIELKKAGVSDELILVMFEMDKKEAEKTKTTDAPAKFSADNPRILMEPEEALTSAKTVAIEKSSLHPSRQALEKELLKRKDWQDLNLNLVRHKDGADLFIEIGYVSLSWITHRYVWRVYDNKSGTVIAAGETTSWGSLAKNLAREISKKLTIEMK